MEFSSFVFHLLFLGQIFQWSNTIVSSAKVKIPAQNAPTDKLDSLTEQIPSFDSFARSFNKSYPTYVDRMAHMKYYLVRALQTFRSIMRYKKDESTSYLKINEMSDLSPAEVRQLFMSRDIHEKVKPAASELADIDEDDVDDEKDVNIGKRLVQQRIKRDTDDDTDDDTGDDTEDVVYIDHRQSNCLDEPRNQGSCASCYAFATIAFYEWLNCQQTGQFQAFSEQYVIDCSHRHGNQGCVGGNPVLAIMFIKDCGFVLGEEYPYTGIQGVCPFKDSFPYANMGSLRITEPNVVFIPLDQDSLEEYLEYGPIIVIIETSHEFISYGGGVDDNVGHTPGYKHTMLIIGHGRENGKEYWLLRNSHSATYGGNEFGHYKLNKNVDCFRGGSGIGLSEPLFG